DHGYDHWFRLFLSTPGHGQLPGRLPLPEAPRDSDWYGLFRSTAAESRPTMRYVTVREYRRIGPSRGGAASVELDVDVVIHGQPGRSPADSTAGPLSSWAQTAEAGQRVALLDQGTI